MRLKKNVIFGAILFFSSNYLSFWHQPKNDSLLLPDFFPLFRSRINSEQTKSKCKAIEAGWIEFGEKIECLSNNIRSGKWTIWPIVNETIVYCG